MKPSELSKALSHALRHEPWLYELELDDEGWAPLDAVLVALRKQRTEWTELSRDELLRVIGSSSKRRHEIMGDRIRALYGHSVPGKLRRERGLPPALLFHGTAPETAKIVILEGLAPVSRQYVHLSTDEAMAREVGRRKALAPALLQVDAQAAHEAGLAFYEGNERVWLADIVPARFIQRLE